MIFLLLAGGVTAQQDAVLMRINGREVLRSEFEYFYNKNNLQADAAHDVPDKYVDLFINFKLKVQAAGSAGLDTTYAFRKAMEEYRRKLIKSYLTDEEVTGKEMRRLYDARKSKRRSEQTLVSQIYTYLPQNVTGFSLRKAEARMDSIYEHLLRNNTDAAFNACVEKFSDNKQSLWVSSLQMPVEFETIVDSLEVGEMSAPFYTPQGIHIVKVLRRKEYPSFEEVGEKINFNRARHDKVDKGTEAFVEKLKKEYSYVPDKSGMDELMAKGHTERTLFTLDGKEYTGRDFSRFAVAHPAGVQKQLDRFVIKTVLDYENSRLERKHPDLRFHLQGYRDSLLLNDINEEVIGKRVSDDEAALKAYFEEHRSDYHWDELRYKGIVLHCTTKRIAKAARKFLRKLPEEEWKDAIRLTFNADAARPQIQSEQGVFASGDNPHIDDLVFKKTDATPLLSFPFTVVIGKKLKGPEDYQEIRPRLVADYKNYLDRQWITRLRASSKVEINQEVLKTVNNH